MKSAEILKQKLERLQRSAERWGRIADREVTRLQGLVERAAAELDQERDQQKERVEREIARVQEEVNQAGKDFAKKKYQLERDLTNNRNEINKAAEELQSIHKRCETEVSRLKEERVSIHVSFERQKTALRDLYEEKRRHLSISAAKLLEEWKALDGKLKSVRENYARDIAVIESEGRRRVEAMSQTAAAKREGWTAAVESMKKELESLEQERSHVLRQLADVRTDKEKELETARLAMSVAKEQLEIDKATLIEKAEDDQRRTEDEIQKLKSKIEADEKELQSLIMSKETEKKDAEEAFLKEEEALKEAVKSESEKRDFEQKLFEQEKARKEKDVARLKEEYEKKKWHWDNQIRTLMMQKSVQDAEYEAERMRADREARTLLRGLEAQRDELRQRVNDLKSKHELLLANSHKENELVQQRWRWRKDRLWTMWQNRLETLKKERLALDEQIRAIQETYERERAKTVEGEQRDGKRIDELQKLVLTNDETHAGRQKQRAIQLELEKTRILAQIKECEMLVSDWMTRLKASAEELEAQGKGLAAQLNFVDRWGREEEKETELFLHSLQRALSVLEAALGPGASKAA